MIKHQILPGLGTDIAVVTLDNPTQLNALTLDMIISLDELLRSWEIDPNIGCIWLQGSGERAFCAGGNVKQLVKTPAESAAVQREKVAEFFTAEYALDYRVYTYPKPIIAWGNGICFGGGLGIYRACSIRIATEKSQFAMPEVGIGLFPDVGASWFLNRLPCKIGLFLGLTGVKFNAADAMHLGVATHFIRADQKEEALMAATTHCHLPQSSKFLARNCSISKELKQLSSVWPIPFVHESLGVVSDMIDHFDFISSWERLTTYSGDDAILKTARTNLLQGSTLSAVITWKHLLECRHLSLQECFKKDLDLAIKCATHPNFTEGVTAKLIDKNRSPEWLLQDVEKILSGDVLGGF